MDEAQVDRHSAVDIYQWLREVCQTRLLRDPPIVLGGQGIIVEVDESLFWHKPKVANPITNWSMLKFSMFTLQHHHGRATTTEVWVFGIVDTSSQPALGYRQVVQRCDAATLLPIIQAHIAPGLIVQSDNWAAPRNTG